VPVKMCFSIWCVYVPLFVTSTKLQSYVETLVTFSSHCAKWEARKLVLASENSVSGSFLPEAALHFVVISSAMTAVIIACLHGAVSNLSFSFQILFSPSFCDFLLCCIRAFVESTKTNGKRQESSL